MGESTKARRKPLWSSDNKIGAPLPENKGFNRSSNMKVLGNKLSDIKGKTKKDIIKEMKTKREEKEQTIKNTREEERAYKLRVQKDTPNIQNFGKFLFLALKEGLDNSVVANNYLFKLSENIIRKEKPYPGLYKITVVKKDEKGITCRMNGENYTKDFIINNEMIMETKTDALEDMITMPKVYYTKEGRQERTRAGTKEDFLMEINHGDSVIIRVESKKTIKKVTPDDIIEEIRGYVKSDNNERIKARQIQTAMKFLNESKSELSSQYIKDIFKLVRERQADANKGETQDQLRKNFTEYKKHFATVLKKYLSSQKNYLHAENDIDKSTIKFLLQKFGIHPKDGFREVQHDKVEQIKEGVVWDASSTANGIKVVEGKTGKKTKNGKDIMKRKIIISEHKDASDKAMLSNRPASTTQMIFKIFKELGAIRKEELYQVQNFVNFVNTVDSMDYQITSIDYKHNYQTLFGLYRTMGIKDIFDYFRNPDHTGFERLSEGYMKNMKTTTEEKTLWEVAEKHKVRIEKNIQNFEKIQKKGNELEYKGINFIVDIEERAEDQLKDAPQTAGYHGYGYFAIKPERKNLYLYSPKKLPAMIEGYPTDGHFLIINNLTQEDLKKVLEMFRTPDTTVKEKIMKRFKSIQEKSTGPITEKDITSFCQLFPPLTKKDLKVGKTYKAIINNDIQNKQMYVTMNKDETIKGRIRVEDKTLLKGYKKGDIIIVKLDEIAEEEGKLMSVSLVNTKG